jgi:hypothetical protein
MFNEYVGQTEVMHVYAPKETISSTFFMQGR